MTTDERTDLEDRIDDLEHKLDRLIVLMARMTDDLEQAAAQRDSMETALTDLRSDVQRGFSELRHTVRHLVARVGEVPRWR
jgi:predicted  nucleic acid-binding Zn-ribbon protein